MRYLLKNKFVLPLSLLFFVACTPPQSVQQPPKIYSSFPVDIKIGNNLQQLINVERVVVVPQKDKYIVQFTVKSNSNTRVNFLYRVLAYNQQGLIADYLTEKWNFASIDPYGERHFEVVIPKKVIGKLSRVEIDLKTFAP
jgi:uncharacterized protein YcfL